eukprot:5804241-Pyramimonas_sp.AAC.1
MPRWPRCLSEPSNVTDCSMELIVASYVARTGRHVSREEDLRASSHENWNSAALRFYPGVCANPPA